MSDVGHSVANLSPEEKRALLAKMLAKKANAPQRPPRLLRRSGCGCCNN